LSSTAISLITFVCIFGGALVGLFLSTVLPKHHLSDKTMDAIKVGTGLIGTLAALVLGLLISSAISSFDTVTLSSSSAARRLSYLTAHWLAMDLR
jgi:flagellar biosynthesis component FlhA